MVYRVEDGWTAQQDFIRISTFFQSLFQFGEMMNQHYANTACLAAVRSYQGALSNHDHMTEQLERVTRREDLPSQQPTPFASNIPKRNPTGRRDVS
jgi:hypothetical protein